MTGNKSGESDESLLRLIKRGDRDAFAALVHRHNGKFYGLAWRMLGDQGEAEDVVQDAFLKLWQNPGLYNEDKNVRFTTWFYRVVTNLAIDRSRKRGKMVTSDNLDLQEAPEDSPEKNMAARQQQEALEAAIQNLPDTQKAALNLCFYEGVSNKEAASILGVNVKALESLLMRAKAGIKNDLIRSGFISDRYFAGGRDDDRQKKRQA